MPRPDAEPQESLWLQALSTQRIHGNSPHANSANDVVSFFAIFLALVASGFTVSRALPQAKVRAGMLGHVLRFGALIATAPSPL
jgi:hypothetical protein